MKKIYLICIALVIVLTCVFVVYNYQNRELIVRESNAKTDNTDNIFTNKQNLVDLTNQEELLIQKRLIQSENTESKHYKMFDQ